jgi:hypothetical protein
VVNNGSEGNARLTVQALSSAAKILIAASWPPPLNHPHFLPAKLFDELVLTGASVDGGGFSDEFHRLAPDPL